MPFNKFFIGELADVSNGIVVTVKNYYDANGLVIVHSANNGTMYDIKDGMTITGRSSGFSKVITNWKYSTPQNDMSFDFGFSTYKWQDDLDDIIITDTNDMIVLTEIYNSYPKEILDYQIDEALTQK